MVRHLHPYLGSLCALVLLTVSACTPPAVPSADPKPIEAPQPLERAVASFQATAIAAVDALPLPPPIKAAPHDEPLLNEAGYQLILEHEVGGGQTYYNRFLQRPTWPGEQSGVTVGIGYDCGYNTRTVILSDWAGMGGGARLAAMAGITGIEAKAKALQVRDILIEWKLAERVFQQTSLEKFYLLTRKTFPGFDDLHPNCQAALVSLVFNRGSSMTGERRREMRDIRAAVPEQNYRAIAKALRSMKRIWNPSSGLIRRREDEARLVEASI
jgi:GH24 family phage-related lysozyme (muramidase)